MSTETIPGDAGPYVAAAEGPDAAQVTLDAAQALFAAMPELEADDLQRAEERMDVLTKRLQEIAPAEMQASIEAMLPDVEIVGEISPDPLAGVDVGKPAVLDAPLEVIPDGGS